MSQQWEHQSESRPYGGYGNGHYGSDSQHGSGSQFPPYRPGPQPQPYAPPPQYGQPAPYYPVVAAPVVPVAVVPQKSPGTAGVLAFFFGPIGMLYSTPIGALVTFLINIVFIWFTFGLILVLTIPAGVVWAVMAANEHNRRFAVVASPPPVTYR